MIYSRYSPSKLDPQRWNVETNREVILNLFSDARTLAPMISFANYQSKANRQSYFYVFGHNSVSTEYAAVSKLLKIYLIRTVNATVVGSIPARRCELNLFPRNGKNRKTLR